MDSKIIAHTGTYLGLVFALFLLGMLLPELKGPATLISCLVSAVYLYLLPFWAWVRVRLIVEAIKIPVYYTMTIELYEIIVSIRITGVLAVTKIVTDALPHLSPEEAQAITAMMETQIASIPGVNPLIALIAPLIAIAMNYAGVWVIYIYLHRINFYRRLII